MKRIGHIDLNAFFAQCEILKDPSLIGKPLAVGSDSRRGVISTASYEARKFGVRSGMPVSNAKKLCPTLILKPDDFAFYSLKSREFMSYLHQRFPIMEKASIDECYLDMTEFLKEGHEHETLFDLQMAIYKSTKLKCSIGLSYNRFLAKMASDMKKPLGITIIDKNNLEELLWPLDIESMYGVGKKTAPKLRNIGIETIGDLARFKDPILRKIVGSYAFDLVEEANGIASDVIDVSSFDPKSISAERTFSEDVSDYEELRSMISSCAKEASDELNRYHKECKSVAIKIRTSDFVTRSKRKSSPVPLSKREDVFSLAMQVFDQFYKGEPVRLIGVSLEHVENPSEKTEREEPELFDWVNDPFREEKE